MENMIVVLDRCRSGDSSVSVRIRGQTSRRVAHHHGITHGAVQVAVVAGRYNRQGKIEPNILLHKRSRYKDVDAGKWDICGGHIAAGSTLIHDFNLWEEQDYIEQLFFETALREVNEECRIHSSSSNTFKFECRHLRRYGAIGGFESGLDGKEFGNREYSTLYCAFVPFTVRTMCFREPLERGFYVTDSTFAPLDEQPQTTLPLRLLSPLALVRHFKRYKDSYADGVSRILIHLAKKPAGIGMFIQLLQVAIKEVGMNS